MTNDLVQISNNQVITTSLMIADVFEKRHKNVVRDIESLEIPENFRGLNFEPSGYIGENGHELPMYNITRDGFTLLAMGYTGKKAMEFKLKYIEAFNSMEQKLADQRHDEEIDDMALEYDAGNIEVAEFELRAVKVICQLFGRDVAKQAYMSSKYLPKPVYSIDGRHDASATACLEYLKTMFVSGYPLPKVIDNKCVDMLKPAGLDIVENMVCIATSSREVAKHFANSRWAGAWTSALLELPHAERGRAAKRFAGVTAKYIMVPTFYFRETIHVKQ